MLRVIDETTDLPVSVSEAKLYARIPYDIEDSLVSSWIKAGTELAEGYQRRTYIRKTLEYSCDGYPSMPLYLPSADKCRLIDYVSIYDTDSSAIVLYDSRVDPIYDPGYLDINLSAKPTAAIDIKYGTRLPTVKLRGIRSFVCQFFSGADSSSEVSPIVRDAIFLYCAYRNDNRTGEHPIPEAFWDLLAKERLYE